MQLLVLLLAIEVLGKCFVVIARACLLAESGLGADRYQGLHELPLVLKLFLAQLVYVVLAPFQESLLVVEEPVELLCTTTDHIIFSFVALVSKPWLVDERDGAD